MADFIHLHNHSDFSLQDGAQTVQMLCDRCDDLGMQSIALTEHGNLFSMIPFYKSARASGLKPILGCEVYVAINDHKEKKQINTASGKKWGYHHLVLLVQNEIGYKKIIGLSSKSYLEQDNLSEPNCDFNDLLTNVEGIIILSGTINGLIGKLFNKGKIKEAEETYKLRLLCTLGIY